MLFFYDDLHAAAYSDFCKKMSYLDCYHASLAYLLALDPVLRQRVDSVYNFKHDCIKLESLSASWQTDTSKKTTRLAFNLWNGCCSDSGEIYSDDSSSYFTPSRLFDSEYSKFYLVAIQLRFQFSA